jgi:hypothetical protein
VMREFGPNPFENVAGVRLAVVLGPAEHQQCVNR